jgi:hypothetical protein
MGCLAYVKGQSDRGQPSGKTASTTLRPADEVCPVISREQVLILRTPNLVRLRQSMDEGHFALGSCEWKKEEESKGSGGKLLYSFVSSRTRMIDAVVCGGNVWPGPKIGAIEGSSKSMKQPRLHSGQQTMSAL